MASSSSQPPTDYPDHISHLTFEQLVSVRGEGDEWDFKATLSNLASTSARVNLAKAALAFCNLPAGGTIIVGVTDDYEHVGLNAAEKIDTTVIRRAIEKYIDGDFIEVAAEHILVESGANEEKRYGIIHFRRRFAQPVLAALDGQITNDKPPLFRSGDILIRRGAASIRANSGDVRRPFTNSVVHEERVRAVNELWSCLVEQRRLMGGVEYLYDILADSEYPDVITRSNLRVGGDAAVVLGRPAEMVAVPGRRRCRVGPGVAGRGEGFQLLDPADGQAAAADLPAAGGPPVLAGSGSAEPGDRQARVRRRVCAVHRGA